MSLKILTISVVMMWGMMRGCLGDGIEYRVVRQEVGSVRLGVREVIDVVWDVLSQYRFNVVSDDVDLSGVGYVMKTQWRYYDTDDGRLVRDRVELYAVDRGNGYRRVVLVFYYSVWGEKGWWDGRVRVEEVEVEYSDIAVEIKRLIRERYGVVVELKEYTPKERSKN